MTTPATGRVRPVVPGRPYVGRQGIAYGAAASAETAGAAMVCMNVMPHSTPRLARALAMLKNKHVEMPAGKYDNLSPSNLKKSKG